MKKRSKVVLFFAAIILCVAFVQFEYSKPQAVTVTTGVFDSETDAQRAAFKELSRQIRIFPHGEIFKVSWQLGKRQPASEHSFLYRKSDSSLLYDVIAPNTRHFTWRFPFMTTQTIFDISDQWPREFHYSVSEIHEAARRDMYLGKILPHSS